MTVSQAQKKATAKYEQQNYDKVLLRLAKGKKNKRFLVSFFKIVVYSFIFKAYYYS